MPLVIHHGYIILMFVTFFVQGNVYYIKYDGENIKEGLYKDTIKHNGTMGMLILPIVVLVL